MALKPAIHRPYKPPSFKPWKPPKPAALKPGQGYLSPGQRAGLAKLKPGQLGASIMGDIGQWASNWNASQGQQQQQPSGGGGLIGGDWEVQLAETDLASGMARSRGDFQANLRQALIDLGISDTSKLGNLSQYIDADTIKAAAENKYSTNAQITQKAIQSRAQNNAQLAARGLLSSGQTTKSQQDVSAGAENNRMMALREFLSGGASGLTQLADQEAALSRAVAQARGNAAMRAAETYPGAFAGEQYDPTAQAAQTAAARKAMLSRQQFLAKRPQGKYQNYVRAFKRHTRQGY